MSFTSAITTTDEEAMDTLFGKQTPGADDLTGGVKPTEDDDKGEGDEAAKAAALAAKAKAKKAGASKVDFEAADISHLSNEEVVDDLFPGEELGEDGKPIVKDDKSKAKPAPVKPVDAVAKAKALPDGAEVDYETVYNKMVEDGVWEEVKVPEGVEWNADTFKKIQQFQTTLQYKDLLDKTGPYGKTIIEFEKNGGNVGEILGLFREQRVVQEFDIKTPEGQENFMRSYLEAQGNSEKSIERQIKALQDQGPEAFLEEATEKKTLWDEQFTEEIEARKTEQALLAKQQEEASRNFHKVITDTLVADPDATPKERRELREYMLTYPQAYNGKQVSQFYMDMAEIQKDPTSYVELAKFIKGLKSGDYKKKVEANAKKVANANSFLKIKNNATLQKTAGGAFEVGGDEGDNFVTLLKKRSQ